MLLQRTVVAANMATLKTLVCIVCSTDHMSSYIHCVSMFVAKFAE